jgi:CBS domain-containing protein
MALERFLKREVPVPVLAASDTVAVAIHEMIESGAGAVLIASSENALEGIFTERDVMTRITAENRDASATLLSELMTVNPVALGPDTSITDAIDALRKHKIRHLPVVRANGEIVGMISLRKLLHDHIQELMDELRSLEAYLNDAPGG